MRELLCNYATIRFLPYRETGEFVNVGVIAHFPAIGYLDFILLGRQIRRVSTFFPELKMQVFRAAKRALESELLTHRLVPKTPRLSDPGVAERQLGELQLLTRRRESLLHFTQLRTRLFQEDPAAALRSLYAEQVERNFAKTPEYREEKMAKRLGSWLREWHVSELFERNKRIGNDVYHVAIPFVRVDQELAMKPLDLNRQDRTDVLNHGDTWIQKIRRLGKVSVKLPQFVFPTRFPVKPTMKAAAEEIAHELQSLGANVVAFNDRDRIKSLTN